MENSPSQHRQIRTPVEIEYDPIKRAMVLRLLAEERAKLSLVPKRKES
jgi:hypothetical protein